MAATSPYQNNDYQAVSTYRPYQLPINDIFKAISAQNMFWDMGAQRVKNVYDNALGLNLVTDENRTTRDEYLKEAQKQLTKLSSMNLADPSIQRQGIDIFKPLLKDENIVGEDYVVRNLSKEIATGQSFRTMDGGKQYNPLSLENLQFEKNLLSTALNKRDGWKSLANNMSTYTPAHDVTGELKKITDLVKAEEIKNAQVVGDEWYIQEINKKGVSKDKIQAAIQELGSPQLKAHMRAEGRNVYYKQLAANPAGVDAYFQSVASNLFDQKVQDIKNQKAEIDYQNYMIPDKAGNRTKKDAYQAASDNLKKTIEDLEFNQKPQYLAELMDMSNLEKLSSNISKAESLWQSASIHQLAPTLAWESSSQELKPNSAKIAKENINVAIQRLNLGYANLAEDKRHNLMTEQDARNKNLIDMMRIQNKGAGSSSPSDPVFGGSGSTGYPSTPTPTPGIENEADLQKIGAATRQEMLNNSDEPLRQVTVSNIIGENAWAGLQQNVTSAAPISQNGALTDTELDKAAQFFKAFADKYGGKQINNVYIPAGSVNASADFWKREISSYDVGKFKRMIGNMVKHDTEFAADLVGKLAEENGAERAATLRAEINKSTREQMNLTNIIFRDQVPALGGYARFFDNGGKVPLTDQNIRQAYLRAGDEAKIYYQITDANQGRGSKRVPISEAKYNELKSKGWTEGVGIDSYKPSLREFTAAVRRQTDPVFARVAAEHNTQMTTYDFGSGKDEDPQKLQKLQSLRNLVPAADTDARPEISDVMNFMESRIDKVKGYNLFSPTATESSPSMQIIMSGLNKEDQEAWEKIKNVRIPVVATDKAWFQKGSASGNFRFPGAILAVTPINNAEGGEIKISNDSRDPGKIAPVISVKDVYVLNNGQKRAISNTDIKNLLENQFKMPLNTLLESYLEEVNTFLSAYATNIEMANKKAKESKAQR